MTSPEPSHPRERLLFIGSGVLLLLAVLFGIAREQRWGTRFVHVYLKASDVSGLHSGEEVRISGFPVGQVGQLEFNNDASVRVQLKVEESKAHLIGPSSTARLAQEGFVGDRYVVISPDPQKVANPRAIDGKTIAFNEPLSLTDALEDLSNTQRELQATLRNTTALTAKDGDINTTLADLRQTLKSTNTLTATIEREAAATAPVVRGSLDNVSAEISQVSQEARVAEKEAQRLLKDSRPLVMSTLKDVRDLANTSRQLINTLMGVLGPWLEPTGGPGDTTKPEQTIRTP